MKKLIIFSMLLLSFCGGEAVQDEIVQTTEVTEMTYDKTYTSTPEMSIDVNSTYTAELETSLGNIVIELFTDTSPITVNNFVNLSNDGYYNDVIFHRVIKGFMIQGGDPSGTGHGDMGKYPGYDFEDELDNPMNYEKGIVAMANRGPNTNGSQFFIMHEDYPLPYQYTIFGKVLSGLDVVDAIGNVQTGENDKPNEDVVILNIKITSG
ncbi:MAG: peptidylprolyl isomerase [Candidatus Actinomarina sp.]|jgi:peptidylprolyl isomerase|tara:strand:- start:584 stop:1207 length:624 start_codon:yes stop_codon:yes gene_type:complete